MAHCARGKYAAAVLILSLFAGASAYAAAENASAEKPAQTAAPDDKSYLPPWMSTQPASPAPGAPLKEGVQAQGAQAAEASDAKKAKGPARASANGGAIGRADFSLEGLRAFSGADARRMPPRPKGSGELSPPNRVLLSACAATAIEGCVSIASRPCVQKSEATPFFSQSP